VPLEILKRPYKDDALQQRLEELKLVGMVWYSRWGEGGDMPMWWI
jgi:hypothetical protein